MARPSDDRPEGMSHHAGPWTPDDVLAMPGDRLQRVEPADGALLVGPRGTHRHERSAFRLMALACVKRKLCAEGGAPHHLVVDPEDAGITATLFEPSAGEHVEVARGAAGALTLDKPFPVTIELPP
ncbi:hypothetical protein [Saccharothrix australiensis]|uniref:Uncharacterized protein n=1 Tax=Saccharothrix australiensis TaxID=2072 RepID=A0A495W7M6_9PSEU|nr:hypothetical protein [Saccharothrix australiensis]RKT56815.1 hypothetical protein C8E97_5527 [Saccharothrix australiensis]